jgi:hypothetical protein
VNILVAIHVHCLVSVTVLISRICNERTKTGLRCSHEGVNVTGIIGDYCHAEEL